MNFLFSFISSKLVASCSIFSIVFISSSVTEDQIVILYFTFGEYSLAKYLLNQYSKELSQKIFLVLLSGVAVTA